MNYLNNISAIIYSAGRGSQCICSHTRSLKHPWRCKGTPEATKPERFLNQGEEKNRSCLTGDASLVYPYHPAVVPHQRTPVWLCRCRWPRLSAAPPALQRLRIPPPNALLSLLHHAQALVLIKLPALAYLKTPRLCQWTTAKGLSSAVKWNIITLPP